MKHTDLSTCEELLLEHGYRVTKGRVALLSFLMHSKKPLSVGDIQKEIKYTIDKVTLYRALEDFSSSKIVAKINLQNSATYYEFLHKDHHHHHIICEICGKIEDIETCNQSTLQKEVIKSSKYFTVINPHSLEFFGTCKTCSK